MAYGRIQDTNVIAPACVDLPHPMETQFLREATATKILPIGSAPSDARPEFFASRRIFSALFLSNYRCASEGIRRLFETYGVELHCAQTAAEADQWVRGRRLDVVLCDYDAPGASGLACLQPNTRWRGISMVIVGSQHTRDLRGRRIHFTLAKPLSLDVVGRTLRASYTTMARHRFAAYRHTLALKPLAGTLEYRGRQRPLAYTSIANLSQTGLCLAGPEPLPQGGSVSINFSLPDTDEILNVLGTIIWSDASGKSGVSFRGISSEQERRLQQSLKPRLPWNVDSLIPAD